MRRGRQRLSRRSLIPVADLSRFGNLDDFAAADFQFCWPREASGRNGLRRRKRAIGNGGKKWRNERCCAHGGAGRRSQKRRTRRSLAPGLGHHLKRRRGRQSPNRATRRRLWSGKGCAGREQQTRDKQNARSVGATRGAQGKGRIVTHDVVIGAGQRKWRRAFGFEKVERAGAGAPKGGKSTVLL